MKPFLIALAFSRALDVTSTCQGLNRGLVEANWMLPNNCVGQVAEQAGLASAQILILAHVHKKRPKLAIGLAIALSALEVGAAVHNWRIQ